jgi:hypothetical protein
MEDVSKKNHGSPWGFSIFDELRRETERATNKRMRELMDAAQVSAVITGDARFAVLSGSLGETRQGVAPINKVRGAELPQHVKQATLNSPEAMRYMQAAQDAWADSVVYGVGVAELPPIGSLTGVATRVENIEARATVAERTRILAALQSLKPRIRPSHGDWARAWREEAALDMWNKVVALVAQEAPKGE